MGLGSKRHKTELYVGKIEDVKAPNWVTKYNLFRSTQNNTSPEAIRKEYTNTLDSWLQQNPDGTSDQFRSKYGIVIDENGNELLTSDFNRKRLRQLREVQQRPSGAKEAGESRQAVKKPFFADFEPLEGHHKRGLANLGVFFDGATPKQAFEMRQRMLNENFIGGTDRRNWAWLNKKQHDLTHKILGYASDAEIDDPKFKGVEFFDLDKSGRKGVSGLSDKFKNYIKTVPFDRPDTGFGESAKNWTGPIVTDFDDLADPSLGKGSLVNRGDLLMEYLRNTDEAFEKSISQARKLSPQNLPLDKLAPDLAQTTGKQFGINNSHLLRDAIKSTGKFTKVATGLGSAEAAVMLASGQVIPGTLAVAMQTPAVQKKVATLLAKQGLKLIPGLSFGSGVIQGAGYALSGQPAKALLSVGGGLLGEIPGIGDAAQATIDLGLTVHDVKTAKSKKTKKTGDIETPDNLIRKTGRALKTIK